MVLLAGRLGEAFNHHYNLRGRILNPVIIEAEAGKLSNVREMVRDLIPLNRLRDIRPLGLGVIRGGLPSFPFSFFKEITGMGMVASVFLLDMLEEVAQWRGQVKAIYPDRQVYALQEGGIPIMEPQGVFTDKRGRHFTSTAWTKRQIGADQANQAGYKGRGVKAVVIDSGARKTHPQLRRVQMLTSAKEKGMFGEDANGHGCVIGDTKVYTSFCGVEEFSVLFDRLEEEYGSVASDVGQSVFTRGIYTLGFADGKATRVPILGVHKIPYEGVLWVVEAGQMQITATPWHLFLVRHPTGRYRYVRADELKLGMSLVIPNREAGVTDGGLGDRMGYLAGLVVGDGHLTHSMHRTNLVLISGSKEDIPKIRCLVTSMGYGCYTRKDGNSVEVYGLWKSMASLGIPIGAKSRIARVPEGIFKSHPDAQKAFLAGLFDADGWFHKTEHRLKLVTASKQLAKDVQYLLATFGVVSRVYQQKADTRDRKIKGGVCYQLQVSRSNATKLRGLLAPLCYLKKFKSLKHENRRDTITVTSVSPSMNFKGSLYDFTTPSQNYLAGENGMAFIHNSWCTATVGGAASVDGNYGAPVEGMAPECGLISIQSLGFVVGTGASSDVIQAMDMAIGLKADVVSMSLGSNSAPADAENPEAVAIKRLVEAGIIPVIAAGNSGPDMSTVGSPGSVLESLTVGAADTLKGELADFSSRGPTSSDHYIKPDVISPGVRIDSALVGFLDAMTEPTGRQYGAISGTSMATPHVAGLLACARQFYKERYGTLLTVDMVKDAMNRLGHEKDNETGWGLLSWDILTEYADEVVSPPPADVIGQALRSW